MKRILLSLAALAALATAAAAHDTPAARVTALGLNLRKGPGTEHGLVAVAERGEVHPVLVRQGSWVRLQYGAREVWAHGGYLDPSTVAVRTVNASSLNVRTGPSTGYRVLAALPRGTRVAVLRESGRWREITFESRKAWVHGDYLATPGDAPPPSSPPPSEAGFIQLPASGQGFYGYYSADRRWGRPDFVYGIERIARRWDLENRGPRIGVGDISLRNGGPISGHVSHRLGVDADFRAIRNDGVEGRVTIFESTYSRPLTQRVFDLFADELRLKYVFFNDRNTRHTTPWPNHDNHFHVRIYQ